MKALHDSFASLLLTAGVPLPYMSKQLGHSQITTTQQHYAAWCLDGDEYQAPLVLAPGEDPAELLARITGPIRTELDRGADPLSTGTGSN